MSDRRFLSWPAGWRKALPWGLLSGVVVAGTLVLAEGPLSARHTIDRSVLVDAAVVVGSTALVARLQSSREKQDEPNP